MTTRHLAIDAGAQGHVALYARDGRWRRAMAESLEAHGHSYQQAANADEIRRVLLSQRFDVLALKVRDNADAQDIAAALEDITLPPHGILVGDAGALPLVLGNGRGGTIRYVPGRLAARELSRLVEASISSGTAEDGLAEGSGGARIDEVDVEEVIERAAAAVYPQAKRRRLRFSTVVEGAQHAYADAVALRRVLVALLRLIVTLAPRGALVSVEARAAGDEWTVRIATAGTGSSHASARLAESLREESRVLTSASRDVQQQGGLFWVELTAPGAFALCLTLPTSPDAQESESTVPAELPALPAAGSSAF